MNTTMNLNMFFFKCDLMNMNLIYKITFPYIGA